ncbi:Internalin-A [Kordia antarctica]|uniref:Internalin-A n=1 Tax=Kordia antarctica TaxID=1218801 RepID=A0A7L4ZRY7_9FLAO|nr:leucine-rich repeat domain-containing protein [Kordia antarctica]QHI38604.1 Internalin-A [Kordia antarctica]
MNKPQEILELEEVYGITLTETKNEGDITQYEKSNLYLLDANAQVIGLNLNDNEITKIQNLDKLTQLEVLNLSKNKISKIENLDKLTNLTELSIYNNQISKIENIEKLTNLQWLYISGNQISKIENLDKLTNLTQLYISYNQISKIENIEKLTNLTQLDIYNNQITKIENLEKLTNLTKLDISSNQIAKIENIEKLTNLTKLDISSNQIAKIENIENLTNISKLNISKNKISKIENIEKLSNLTQLDIASNKITKIENIEKLTNLTELYITGNQISKIENIDKLTNLNELYISMNQISKIENIEKLTNLSKLSIWGNQITKIENLEKLTNISQLDISFNQITKIENIEKLSNLTQLDIYNNQISKIENLEKLTKLTQLSIYNNQISNIENIEKLTNLRQLDISSNKISNIENIEKLTNLTKLYLSDNQISNIYLLKQILNLQALRYLRIHNNPFIEEQNLVLKEGENHLDTIKNELYKLEENTELIQLPVKVMLLGNHASGKSTLLQYIRTKSFRKSNRSTHVLSVIQSRKKINFKLPKAIFYDFGGQDYYHGIYQAFFTQEAVNMLVWNPKSDANKLLEKDSNELSTRNYNRMYWLAQLQYSFLKRYDSLKTYIDPLLLVQTHADKHPLKNNWNETFDLNNVIDEFHVSLNINHKTTRNTAALNHLTATFWDVVEKQSSKKEEKERKVPEWFPEFLHYILKNKQKEKHVTLTEISKQFERKKLSEIKKITFLKEDLEQLARKGLLLYYKNDDELNDVAWLNPAAIVKHIHKTILSKKSIQNKKGKLTNTEFDVLKVDSKIRRLLLNEKVLFHDTINEEYIIPNYLPLTSDDTEIYDLLKFDFNKPTFVLKFERFIPFGLINQLICHYGQNPDKKHYWRDQLIFTINDQFKVWIQLDFSKLTISVSIKPRKIKDPELNDCIQKIFREILYLYWNKTINRFSEEEVENDLKQNIHSEKLEANKLLNNHYKEEFKKLTKPKDLYLSVDGTHFVHYKTLDNSKKTHESINSFPLKEEEKLHSKEDEKSEKLTKFYLDKTAGRTQRSYKYRNFTDNPNIKKMKKIFISYSRKDVEYKDELRKHLNMLKIFDVADNWSCEDITIGKWHDQIQKELEESDLVIFMLSINFFGSDYILDQEVINTMNNIAAGSEKKVLCVIVSKFAGLENFDEEKMNSRQKAIIKLASFQYASYFKEENKLTGNKEERLISLKEASRLGILDEQLTKVMEKIMKEIS